MDSSENVINYLDSKGFNYTIKSNEAVMDCPACNDNKKTFAINIVSGFFQCWRKNKCGIKGNLYKLKEILGDIPKVKYTEKVYKLPDIIKDSPDEKMLRWFRRRKISEQTVKDFKIKCKNNAIVFQYFKDGKLVNNKYRSYEKKQWQEKDAEGVLYNRDQVPESITELIIVEGEIDCMSLWELGIKNAVSIPGGATNLDWIANEWDYLQRFDCFLLAYDIDRAGNDSVVKVADRLGRYKCRRVNIPYKDANEWLQKGLTYDKFMETAILATDFMPDEAITTKELKGDVFGDRETGRGSGFERFDNKLGGFRAGEVTVWTGRNGDGKSTFLNQTVAQVLKKDEIQKFCVASFEMKPEMLIRWMMKQTGLGVIEENWQEFLDIIGDRIYFINTNREMNPDKLLDTFNYLYMRFGVQNYLIDSLLRINLSSRKDRLESEKDFMNLLTGFAADTNTHIHLVAHPRKGDTDHKVIYKVDIAGSGDIGNLAFNVISIQRSQYNDDKMTLTILKNRIKGTLGYVNYIFNPEFKRFKEVE